MNKQRFRDYSVIVTGASSGIGAATAQAFAREGARVVLAARRTDRLADLQRRISAFNPMVLAIPTDVGDDCQVQDLVDHTLARFGRVDILVNNAGVSFPGRVLDLPIEQVDSMFRVNVHGLLACSRAVVPHMRERGIGHIVNVSSIAGYITEPTMGIYAATKHAVQAISTAMGLELAADGIRVTTICPGPIATEIGQIGPMKRADPYSVLRLPSSYAAGRILTAVHKGSRQVFIPSVFGVGPFIDLLVPDLLARLAYTFRPR